MKLTNQPKTYRGGGYTLSRAFTLIELLVVIAIIGILATVVIASLNSARAKARDARRISTLQSIAKAYQMYYMENGAYPPGGGAHSMQDGTNWANTWLSHKTALAPYIDLPLTGQTDHLGRFIYVVSRCGQPTESGVYLWTYLEQARTPYNPCGTDSGDIFFSEIETTKINNGLTYAIRLE